MPEQIKYVTDGAETYGADPSTGFERINANPKNSTQPLREDSNGDTYVGDTWSPPQGFLSRPRGWDR